MFKGLIYVAGPYRSQTKDGVKENIRRAQEAAVGLWRQGWVVICPHANTAGIDYAVSEQTFLAGDLEILKRCDAIYLLRGWKNSKGAVVEYRLALTLNKQILYEEAITC